MKNPDVREDGVKDVFIMTRGDMDEPLRWLNASLADVGIQPHSTVIDGQFLSIGASAQNGKPEQLGWLLCALIEKVCDLEERLAAVEGHGTEVA